MAGATDNFGFVKPAAGENYDVDILNNNADAIDTAIFGRLSATAPFGHMGKTNGFQALAGTDIAVVMTGAQKLVGGMTFEAASAGRLVIPIAGRYLVSQTSFATNGSAYKFAGAAYYNSVKIPGTEMVDWKQDGTDWKCFGQCEINCLVGDKIGMGMTSPQSTWGTTGYDGSFIEVRYVGP